MTIMMMMMAMAMEIIMRMWMRMNGLNGIAGRPFVLPEVATLNCVLSAFSIFIDLREQSNIVLRLWPSH